MQLSVKKSLKYPWGYSVTRGRSVVMMLLSVVPFAGSLLVGYFAAAAVSVITIEGDEAASLSWEELFSRSVRALFSGFVMLLYLIPAFAGLYFVGFTWFSGGDITWPAIGLLAYIFLVVSAWPLAVLHAVTTGHIWDALHMPKLIWIGLKIDLKTFLRLLVISGILFGLKTFVYLATWTGFGFLLIPVQAYSEYVFQYALAMTYASAIRPLHRPIVPALGVS